MARKENIIRTNDKVANIATEYTSDKIPQFRKYITLEEFFQMNQNETTSSENAKIQWHPGFYAAAEIELRHNRNELEFHREYNLSKKPLQVDLLIIEKLNDIHLRNELGAIFRRYNIIEYKAPKDQLNIDVFFKTLGYAFLYKGLGESVNRISLEELTVSLFREAEPIKLMRQLTEYGYHIRFYAPGIYYVEGLPIPIQIVVTEQLRSKLHPALKMLSQKLDQSDLLEFMECVNSFTEPGDRQNADAVLQVSVSANREIYDQVRRNNVIMCEALKELFKDELEEAHEKGRSAGLSEGRAAGLTEGMFKGRTEGENRLKTLYAKLEQDGRREEIFQALSDPEILKKLYEEYRIE